MIREVSHVCFWDCFGRKKTQPKKYGTLPGVDDVKSGNI